MTWLSSHSAVVELSCEPSPWIIHLANQREQKGNPGAKGFLTARVRIVRHRISHSNIPPLPQWERLHAFPAPLWRWPWLRFSVAEGDQGKRVTRHGLLRLGDLRPGEPLASFKMRKMLLLHRIVSQNKVLHGKCTGGTSLKLFHSKFILH